MFKTEKSFVIDAPVERVFAYILDPAHVPDYEPGTDEVKDIHRLPDGRYTYTAVTRFLGLHVDFTGEQVEVIPNERIVEKGDSSVMDFVLTFRFKRLEGGKTQVSFVSENTLHGGTLARFGEAFFAKYLDNGTEMAIQAAKARIEAQSTAATPR